MIRLKRLRCSFCRKDETEVLKLVAGSCGYICDKCVAIASQIMSESGDSQPPKVEPRVWSKLWTRARLVFRRGNTRHVSWRGISA
ncbi:MAG: ClpX C4-type zinc finger protein [Pyrinomonadaceae bacterium]